MVTKSSPTIKSNSSKSRTNRVRQIGEKPETSGITKSKTLSGLNKQLIEINEKLKKAITNGDIKIVEKFKEVIVNLIGSFKDGRAKQIEMLNTIVNDLNDAFKNGKEDQIKMMKDVITDLNHTFKNDDTKRIELRKGKSAFKSGVAVLHNAKVVAVGESADSKNLLSDIEQRTEEKALEYKEKLEKIANEKIIVSIFTFYKLAAKVKTFVENNPNFAELENLLDQAREKFKKEKPQEKVNEDNKDRIYKKDNKEDMRDVIDKTEAIEAIAKVKEFVGGARQYINTLTIKKASLFAGDDQKLRDLIDQARIIKKERDAQERQKTKEYTAAQKLLLDAANEKPERKLKQESMISAGKVIKEKVLVLDPDTGLYKKVYKKKKTNGKGR